MESEEELIEYYCPVNVSIEVELLENHQFMSLVDLRHWINKAILVEFYSEESRKLLKNFLVQRVMQTFTKKELFPVGFYAKLGGSDIGLAITAALRALDLPSEEAPLKGYNYETINITAAKEAFESALNEIIKISDCVDPKKLAKSGIFSRKTIEQTYSLIWPGPY